MHRDVNLQLSKAAAPLGLSTELGHAGQAVGDLARLGIDIGMVALASVVVLAFKHRSAHDRRRFAH